MIAVNKQEKESIMRRYPDVKFVRTMKQDSKRHHYYMEEARGPMSYLKRLRCLDDGRQNKKRVF